MARAFPEWIERNGLVARDLRMVFVPTPKVGCTSIMWAMARAEGTAAASSVVSARGEQSRDQTIHDPVIHGLPTLAGVGADERRAILGDPSWTRFCVTRDPYSRLLSGWVNRVLLNSADALGDDLAFAGDAMRVGAPADLGVAFRAFVRELLAGPTPTVTDAHFVPQVSLVRPDAFPYTDVVPLRELAAFTTRTAASSPVRRSFDPQPMNASIRIAPSAVYDAATAALVDAYFAEDFDRLGYERVDFADTVDPLPLTAREAELIAIVREKSDRLYDLQQLHAPTRPIRDGVRRVRSAVGRRVRRTG